jgi:hypothetical protein
MSLVIRMSAHVNKPNIDKVIKNNKRLKLASHSQKKHRKTHRVALDELDTFLEIVDDAIDAMNDTKVEIKKFQEELYDFCGEVPMDDNCLY